MSERGKATNIATITLVALFTLAITFLTNTSMAAAQGQSTNKKEKVTICHRANAVKNPYVQIKVAESAVDGKANEKGNQADHYGEHKGPVATSQERAQELKDKKTKWGDIIPPIEGAHNGLNWTAEGKKIYENRCDVPENEPRQPIAICNDLVAVKKSNNKYSFKADVTAKNGAEFKNLTVDFSDGTDKVKTNQKSVKHTFEKAGDYTVRAVVRFNVGDKVVTDRCKVTVTVEEREKPEEPVYACEAFSATSLGDNKYRFDVDYIAENGAMFEEVTFNFGDGNEQTTTETTVEHMYVASGDYTVAAKLTFSLSTYAEMVRDNGDDEYPEMETVTVECDDLNISIDEEEPVDPGVTTTTPGVLGDGTSIEAPAVETASNLPSTGSSFMVAIASITVATLGAFASPALRAAVAKLQ